MAEYTVSKNIEGNYKTISEVLKIANDGDKIFVQGGCYEESLVIDKDIEIIGDENDVPVVFLDSGTVCVVTSNATLKFIHFTNKDGIEPNQEVYGYHSLVEVSSGAFFENCEFSKSFDGNLQVYGLDVQPQFINCLFHDANRNGVFILYGSKPIFKNCKIYDNGFQSISIINASPTIECTEICNGGVDGIYILSNSNQIFKEEEDKDKIIICNSSPIVNKCVIHDFPGTVFGSASGIKMEKNNGVFRNCRIYNIKSKAINSLESDVEVVENSEYFTFNAEDLYLEHFESQSYMDKQELTTFTIPENIGVIDSDAFSNSQNLEEVYLNSNLRILKQDVFSDCPKLKKIHVPEDNQYYCSIAGSLYSKDKSILYRASCDIDNSFELPKEVTTIEYGAFSGLNKITKLEIHNGVTEIKHYAFANCENLKKIILPSHIEYLGAKVFEYCSSLESVDLPEGITELDVELFYNCSSLKNVIIPEGVDTISHYVFGDCTSLTKLELPSTTRNIYKYAFDGCTALKDFILPEETKAIETYAFSGCTSLEEIEIPAGLEILEPCAFIDCSPNLEIQLVGTNPNFAYHCGTLIDLNTYSLIMVAYNSYIPDSLQLPDGLQTIAEGAFKNCTSLKEIIIPKSVKSIESSAFENCVNLSSVKFQNKTCEIGDSVFKGCEKLEKIKLPKIYNIPSSMFEECKNLKNITITSKSIVNVETEAFKGCINLESIKLPKFVFDESCGYSASIEYFAFSNCTSLKSFVVPKGVEEIYDNAFEDCSSLTKIKIPKTVTSIGDDAFIGCDKLKLDYRKF